MSIKYYRLAKSETPPEEFCAIRDVSGEPSEYVFYVPESDVAKLRQQLADVTESMGRVEERCAKLRKLVDGLTWCCEHYGCKQECPLYDVSKPDCCLEVSIKRELGVEVES